MAKSISEQRTDALLAKARAKIRLLQKYADQELPEQEGTDAPVYFPENATKFAEWEDPDLRLESFNAPNWRKRINSQQYRAADKRKLKEDADRLIKALVEFKAARGKKGQYLQNLRTKYRTAEAMSRSLASQLTLLQEQMRKLQREKAQLEARLEDCAADRAALRQKLAGAGPVVSIAGGGARDD